MVLKKFSCFADDTRLIVYRGMLYKIKVCFKDVIRDGQQENSSNSVHTEIEEVISAVIYMIENDETLVNIQTEHFVVSPSQFFWKTGEKLKFQQNGKDLKVHSNVISLTFMAHPQGHAELRSAPVSSRGIHEESMNYDQHREKDSRNQTKEAQKSDNPSVRKEPVHDTRSSKSVSHDTAVISSDTSRKSAAKPVQSSSKRIVTRNSPGRKHLSPSVAAPPTNVGKGPWTRSRKRTVPDSSPASGHTVQSRQQNEVMQLTTNGQASRLHYALRTDTQPIAQSQPNITRPHSSPTHHSPQKSPRKTAQHRAINYSVGNIDSSDRNTNNSNRNTTGHNTDRFSPQNDKSSDLNTDTSAGPTAHGSKKHQEQASTEDLAAQKNKRGSFTRNAMRIPTISTSHTTKQKQGHHVKHINTNRRQFDFRQTIRRNTEVEEQRLRHFVDDQNGIHSRSVSQPKERSHIHTFEQKDRHVVEQGNAQEERKLQSMANHETIGCRKKSERHALKRNRSLVDVLTDSFVTPIKQALLGQKGTT